MNGNAILDINTPELLFSEANEGVIKKEYMRLAKEWHPDVKKDDGKIFTHINLLYTKALEKLEKGIWEIPGILIIESINGKKFKLKYEYRFPIEFGMCYVGNHSLLYVIDKKFHEEFKKASSAIKFLKYPNPGIKAEFERFMPNSKIELETENSYVMVINKTQDVIPLRGLLSVSPDGVHPRTVAWVISSILNINCFLEYNKIVHTNINLDTYFISPEYHSGLLLGGWWYAASTGKELKRVSRKTFLSVGEKIKREKKIAGNYIDGTLVRSIGRELMGKYMSKKNFTNLTPMINWLLLPYNTADTARDDFRSWDKAMLETFGKRKFHKAGITVPDVYKALNKGNI